MVKVLANVNQASVGTCYILFVVTVNAYDFECWIFCWRPDEGKRAHIHYRHCASKCRTCPVSGFVPNWMWLSSVHKVSELLHFYQPKEKISLFSMFNTCSIFACLA